MAPASPEPARWKRVKEIWDPPVLLSSEKVLSDPCASGTYLYVSPWSPLCMTQVLFKLLCLCWDSEGVDLCAIPESRKSQLPIALQLSWKSAPKSFKARCYGGSPSQCRTGAGEPSGELSPLTAQSWAGEHSVVVISLPLLGHCPEGVGSDETTSGPSCPSQWTTALHVIFFFTALSFYLKYRHLFIYFNQKMFYLGLRIFSLGIKGFDHLKVF